MLELRLNKITKHVLKPNPASLSETEQILVALPPMPVVYLSCKWTVTPASQWAESRWKQQGLSGVTTATALLVLRDENGRLQAAVKAARCRRRREETGRMNFWPGQHLHNDIFQLVCHSFDLQFSCQKRR